VLVLKTVVLQEREKEGGEWEHVLGQGIQSEVDEIAGPYAGERSDPTLHLPIVPQ
jgi:hypothetical protein